MWDDFPERLRTGRQALPDGEHTDQEKCQTEGVSRPCKASTVRTRKAELVAAARMAVREGMPIASLVSLTALLDPSIVEKVIDAYWIADGVEPSTYTIEPWLELPSLARVAGCLELDAVQRLDDIRANLEGHRRKGLTQKNLKLIRRYLPERLERESSSARILMSEARFAARACHCKGRGHGADGGRYCDFYVRSRPPTKSYRHPTG